MVITIFGASGGIGKHAVRWALSEGYEVRAYLRNPAKLALSDERLSVIQGELFDVEKVTRAVSGCDAVLWCVGISMKRHTDRNVYDGHKVMLNAMKQCGVKRLIEWSTPSLSFEKDKKSMLTVMPGMGAGMMFPDTKKELLAIAEDVKASDLDWTIVRFLMPTDKEPKTEAKVSFGDAKIKWAIPRSEIGRFMVSQVKNETYIKSMPIIGS